jgi:hypothetical protein
METYNTTSVLLLVSFPSFRIFLMLQNTCLLLKTWSENWIRQPMILKRKKLKSKNFSFKSNLSPIVNMVKIPTIVVFWSKKPTSSYNITDMAMN